MDIQSVLPSGWFIGTVTKGPYDGYGYALNVSSEFIFFADQGRRLELGKEGRLAFTERAVTEMPGLKTEIVCEPDFASPDPQVARWGLLEDAAHLLALI